MRRSSLFDTTYLNQSPFSGARPITLRHSPVLQADHPTTIAAKDDAFRFKIGQTERGIILSNSLHIAGSSVEIRSSSLDAAELRRALLFWDLIAWPDTSAFAFEEGPEVQFLRAEGRLVRPFFDVGGDAAVALSMAFTQTLSELNKRNPGQWLISNGDRSLKVHGRNMLDDRGLLTTLTNAIPIPTHDMPLEDVLRFKDKRFPEVLALRSAIDSFYQDWVNSEDQEHQMLLALQKISSASSDMISAARETKSVFALSSWKINFNLGIPELLKAPLWAVAANTTFNLDAVSTILSGALSTLSISRDIGLKQAKDNSPFGYIASIHRDLL